MKKLCIIQNLLANIVGHLEVAVSACALGMNHSLRDTLTVKLGYKNKGKNVMKLRGRRFERIKILPSLSIK